MPNTSGQFIRCIMKGGTFSRHFELNFYIVEYSVCTEVMSSKGCIFASLMLVFFGEKNLNYISRFKITLYHPWLSRIPAPVGSQEVVEHTHKLALLIGQCFPRCRLGRLFIIVSDPTCTTFYYPTCTYLLCEVGKSLIITSPSWTCFGMQVCSQR